MPGSEIGLAAGIDNWEGSEMIESKNDTNDAQITGEAAASAAPNGAPDGQAAEQAMPASDTEAVQVTASRQEAEGRAESIRQGMGNLTALMRAAWDRKDHIALGYDTWADYIEGQFGEIKLPARRELVMLMSAEGMSERQISAATGIDKSAVHRDKTASDSEAATREEPGKPPEAPKRKAPKQKSQITLEREALIARLISEGKNDPYILDAVNSAGLLPRLTDKPVAFAEGAVRNQVEAMRKRLGKAADRAAAKAELAEVTAAQAQAEARAAALATGRQEAAQDAPEPATAPDSAEFARRIAAEQAAANAKPGIPEMRSGGPVMVNVVRVPSEAETELEEQAPATPDGPPAGHTEAAVDQAEYDRLRQAHETLRGDREHLQAENANLRREGDDDRRELARLREQLKKRGGKAAEPDSAQDELEELRKVNAELQAAHDKAASKLAKARAELDKLLGWVREKAPPPWSVLEDSLTRFLSGSDPEGQAQAPDMAARQGEQEVQAS